MKTQMISKTILLIITVISLSSCTKTQSAQSEDTLDRIRKTGQIEACTVVYPPEVIKNSKTGGLSGIMIDALNTIALKMNAKIVWHESTFGNLAAELQSHNCDVAAASYFANIPRAEVISFVEPPISYEGFTALVRKDDNRFHDVKDIFAFDKPDITVAVPTGSAIDFWVKEHFKKAKSSRIDVESSDFTRFIVEVSARRADVAIAGELAADLYTQQHPEVADLFATRPFALNPVCWAVRQDDVKWLHFLETALQFLDTQGTTAQLEKKYNAHLLHLLKQYKLQ